MCEQMRTRQKVSDGKPLERALRRNEQLHQTVQNLRQQVKDLRRRLANAEKLLGFQVGPAVLRGWAGSVVDAAMMSDWPIEAQIPAGKSLILARLNLHYVARSRGCRVSVSIDGDRVAVERKKVP